MIFCFDLKLNLFQSCTSNYWVYQIFMSSWVLFLVHLRCIRHNLKCLGQCRQALHENFTVWKTMLRGCDKKVNKGSSAWIRRWNVKNKKKCWLCGYGNESMNLNVNENEIGLNRLCDWAPALFQKFYVWWVASSCNWFAETLKYRMSCDISPLIGQFGWQWSIAAQHQSYSLATSLINKFFHFRILKEKVHDWKLEIWLKEYCDLVYGKHC